MQGKGSEKEQWPLSALLSGRNFPLQLLSWCQTIQFLPKCTWCLLRCCPSTGAPRWVSLSTFMLRPFNRNAWESRRPLSHSTTIAADFTARSYRDFTSWSWNPGLGSLVWNWDPLLLRGASLHSRYSSWLLSTTHGCGSSPFHISTPSTSLFVTSSLYL